MKYFEVEKEIVRSNLIHYLVYADGTEAEDEHENDTDVEICTGFVVYIVEENGCRSVEDFYPVITDTDAFSDNSEEVLEQIKNDYSSPEWQNNNW